MSRPSLAVKAKGVVVMPERLTGTMIPAGARDWRIGVMSEVMAAISATWVTASGRWRTPGNERASRP